MSRQKKSRSLRTLLLSKGINLRSRPEDRHQRKSEPGASNRLAKHKGRMQKSAYEKWREEQKKGS